AQKKRVILLSFEQSNDLTVRSCSLSDIGIPEAVYYIENGNKDLDSAGADFVKYQETYGFTLMAGIRSYRELDHIKPEHADKLLQIIKMTALYDYVIIDTGRLSMANCMVFFEQSYKIILLENVGSIKQKTDRFLEELVKSDIEPSGIYRITT